MNIRAIFRVVILLSVLMVFALPGVYAQQNTLFAYGNAGGQLVIASDDGNFRWIVTNPGEQLVRSTRLAWSPDSSTLFFAIQIGNGASLRLAQPRSQSVSELASVSGTVTGGEWTPNGRAVVAGTSSGLTLWNVSNGSASTLVANGQPTTGSSVSPDGSFLFFHTGNGFAVMPSGGSPVSLPGTNNNSAAGVGLWADNAPLVAYWTVTGNGTTALNVTNASNGNTLTLDSGSAVPVTPLNWFSNTLTLVFRNANGVHSVDVSCLQSGCSQNPTPTPLLPVNATNIVMNNRGIAYSVNNSLAVASANCVNSGNCQGSDVDTLGSIGQVKMGGGVVGYTSNDGTIHLVDLACGASGGCSATQTGVSGTVDSIAGNGRSLLVYSANQLQLLNLQSRSMTPLTQAQGSVATAWSS